MSISGNAIDIYKYHISDSYQALLILGALVVAISLLLMYCTYERILSAQREAILASLSIGEKHTMIPVIGEICYYNKFHRGSGSFVISKWMLRVMQVVLATIPVLNIYVYLFDMISSMINKTEYSQLNKDNVVNAALVILVVELLIVLIMMPINFKVTRRITGSILLGAVAAFIPILGYMLILLVISHDDLIYDDGIVVIRDDEDQLSG